MANKRDPERTQAPDEEIFDVNAPENVAVEQLQEDIEAAKRETGGIEQSIDMRRTTRLAKEGYAPGNLNKFIDTMIPEESVDRNFSTFLGMTKALTMDQYKNDTIKNAGFIKGIVLFAWEEEQTQDLRHGPTGLEPDVKTALRLKVRIPELHSHIPLPLALPASNDAEDARADWISIGAHPTFEASDTSVAKISNGLPYPGEIVYVDFEHRQTQSGPLYLGPVLVDFQFDLPAAPSPEFITPGELGEALEVDTDPGLEFNLTIGQPFNEMGQRTRDVDSIVVHESVTHTRESTHRVLIGRKLSIEYMVDKAGAVTQHMDPEKNFGYHGGGKTLNTGGLNARSIGIEIINRFNASGAKPGEQVIVDYINPPQVQHEACYRLIVSLVKKFPKLKMIFFGLRNQNRFYWRAIGERATGITAHAHYVPFKADGIATAFYCANRARGYSEEESFAYLEQMIQEWRTDVKRNESEKTNYFLMVEQKLEGFMESIKERVTILPSEAAVTAGLNDHNSEEQTEAGSGSTLPTDTEQSQT